MPENDDRGRYLPLVRSMIEDPEKMKCGGEHPKESIFQYEDGKWGWYDETWNPGDDIHYDTREEAVAAQTKYCNEVL